MATLAVTFTYDADEQGFIATAGGDAQLLFSNSVGNPAGSLRSVVSGNGASGASHWDLTTTYEALGVPINSTITAIQAASLDSLCNTFTSGAASGNISGPATLTDGVTVATLTGSRGFNAVDGSWSTDGGVDLTGLSKPSSNTITLRINSTLINQSVLGALIRLFQDNLRFTLAYVETPATSSGGVRPRIGARSPGQIGRPGPVPPGKAVLWQFAIDQKRQSDQGQATGSAAITLGGLTTAGSATFANVSSTGVRPRLGSLSPGEIGRPGPATPGLSRLWQWKIGGSTATGTGVAAASSGAITLGALVVAGSATDTSTSSGDITLTSLTAQGLGFLVTSGGGVVPRLGARSRGKIGRPGPGKPGRSVFWEQRITPIYQASQLLTSASGAITLGSLTVAGVATDTSTSSGAITLSALAASGSSVFTANATGSLTLGSLAVSGSATAIATSNGTGPILLGSLSVAGSAGTTDNAAGAVTLGSLVVAGAGRLTDSATGAITLGSLIVSGAAGLTFPASGAITLAPLTVAGIATATQVATTGFGAITLTGLVVAGSAAFALSASGSITLAPLEVAGVAGLTTTADPDILLAPLAVAGIGIFAPDMVSGGAGVIALAPLVAAGIGSQYTSATGAIVLAPLTAEGAGTSEGGDLSIKIYAEPRMAVVIDTGDVAPVIDPRGAIIRQP